MNRIAELFLKAIPDEYFKPELCDETDAIYFEISKDWVPVQASARQYQLLRVEGFHKLGLTMARRPWIFQLLTATNFPMNCWP